MSSVSQEMTSTSEHVSSSSPYKLLEGSWPILEPVSAVSASVIEAIASEGLGSSITSNIKYLSLGYFYIDAELVEQHPCQRPLSFSHVTKLKHEFETKGIFREENPAVVVGLGEGWMHMQNKGPFHYKITKSSSFLQHLSISSKGPIAQVLRGGHRTKAVLDFSEANQTDEGYWFYQVLLPGKF